MRVLSLKRHEGKTSILLGMLRMRGDDAYLVVHSEIERKRLIEQNNQWIKPDQVVVFGDMSRIIGRPNKQVFIDNLDLCLRTIFRGSEVKIASVTLED